MSQFGHDTTAEEIVDTYAAQVKGRTFLVTGPSANSIGAYAATSLARKAPKHIVLVGRTRAKVDPVIQQIAAIDPAVQTTYVHCELSDLDSVRAAARQIIEDARIPPIDVFINNAGVMALKEYTTDKAGNEMQLSCNHIGHFLLTNLLLRAKAADHPRIVNVSSLGHRISPVRLDDPNWARDGGKSYDKWTAYGQSKTANILFSAGLNKRLASRGGHAYGVHPGSIWETDLGRHLDNFNADEIDEVTLRNTGEHFVLDERKSTSQGAASLLYAGLAPELEQQPLVYINDCHPQETHAYASDEEAADKLWAWTEERVGEKFF
ncbi:hypothetical protein VTK73DRAFT_563 [Phialemonium thermophilum]|uniref:NAD(P)-binding protein n=1 Tax=Phialemonium thermophilum TaxID=223376 RepID=A0ABR3VUQ5_9PEZI